MDDRVFIHRAVEKDDGLLYKFCEVDLLDDVTAFAGVSQHLPAEIGGAHGSGINLVEERKQVGALRELEADERGVSDDAGEKIVEIVGDAAGEDAEAFEFLNLGEAAVEVAAFLFLLLTGGDILHEADQAVRCIAVGGTMAAGCPDPPLDAIVARDAAFNIPLLLGGEGIAKLHVNPGAVLGDDVFEKHLIGPL